MRKGYTKYGRKWRGRDQVQISDHLLLCDPWTSFPGQAGPGFAILHDNEVERYDSRTKNQDIGENNTYGERWA
jgi:hypothetical protein